LGARILAVVDCFDALTSKRHYREPLSAAGAFGYIRAEAGRRFDPAVVDGLERVLEEMLAAPMPQTASNPLSGIESSRNVSEPASGWEEASGTTTRPGGCVLSLIGAAGHEATVMVELTSLFAGAKSLSALLPQVEARLRRLVPLDGMLVHRPGPAVMERIYGDCRGGVEESGVLNWVWKHQRAVLNSRPDAVSAATPPNLALGAGACSILSVPIRDSVASAGVLTVTAGQWDRFSKDDLRILISVAEKLCPTIQNLDRMNSMAAESRLDPLTGAPNRRYLRERFDRSVQQAFEEGEALSVMLCDVDRFKQVNDHYGHSTGDRVLQCVAEVLRRECCEGRYYARLGGDEFVLILPGTSRKDWDGLRVELRQKLIECRFDFGLEHVRVEVSMGFAELSEEHASCERLLDAADHAMYEEKQIRRRPVVIAS
jgi:diguanylate cyclase (GGDEF)-like protein